MGNKQEKKNNVNVLKSVKKKSINQKQTIVNKKTNNQKRTGFNKNTNNQKKTGVNKNTNNQKKTGVNKNTNNQKKTGVNKNTNNQKKTVVNKKANNITKIANTKQVVTKPNEAEILEIGYHALNRKLMDIFDILCIKNNSYDWPQIYINYIRSERNKWVLYSRSLASRRYDDKDRNIALINHASLTLLSLSNQNWEIWDQNLWVILCEYISEMIKDEAQYDKIIEVVLLTAKYEATCLKRRLENLILLVTEDPWWTLFINVEQTLADVFQKCELYILFFALSEQQRARIFTYLSTKNGNEGENLLSHLNLLMTQRRWEDLVQVTDLLRKKRGLLRMLSTEAVHDVEFEEQESTVTTCTTADHTKEDKPEVKYKQEPVHVKHKKEHVDVEKQTAQSPVVAECVKIQLEPSTDHKKDGNELIITNEHEISREIASYNTSSCVKIELDPDADATIKVEDNSVIDKHYIKELTIPAKQLTDVKNEPSILTEIEVVKQENESYQTIKVENNVVIDEHDIKELTISAKQHELNIVTEIKTVKQENVKEEDCTVTPPDITDVKSEKFVEECVSNVQANQDQQVQKKQNTENDVTSSLDKLILQMSFQQINKSILSNTIIEVSEDEDDDCMIQEDKKLEVGQLLNMYCKIVSDQPKRMVKNPLADQKIVKNIEIETKNFIKLCDDESFAVPQGISPNIHERNPSTSSNTSIKSSKMKVQMSAQKQQNQIRRNQSKTNAKVKKLFEKLRNDSQMSCSAEQNSVVVLDDNITPKKRKRKQNNNSPKFNKKGRYFGISVPDSSTFLAPIAVEDSIVETTPKKQTSMHCSTPNTNKITTQPDFIPIISKSSKPENNKSLQNFNEEVTDLTREINRDSFLTIDLTTESFNCSSISKRQNTVIDLDSTVDTDCTVVAVDSDNLSISGESDVTVINMGQAKKDKQMRKFVKGISKLDAAEKGKLLELITQNIFSGCSVVDKKKSSLHNAPAEKSTRATETAEDTYIKEVILGQTSSRNSIGSNIYNPERDRNRTGLRMIVIDGSNVAVEHGRKKVFSVKGLKICIDYFLKRGHVVKAFVPRFRCKFNKSTDPRLLDKLEEQGHVVYTPSREVQGRMITPYDDRYIVQCAAEFDGVIVSGDNYRDLLSENPRWRFIIENRLLMFTWVNDMIMFPRDPLGRNGPTLEQFLRHPNPAPQNNIPQQPLTYTEQLKEYESIRQLPKTYSQAPHIYTQQPQTSNPDEESFPRH